MTRGPLIIPSDKEFLLLFQDPRLLKRGGGLSDIKTFQNPIYYQRGGGIFSLLKGIGKRVLPFLIKNVFPEAIDMGKGVFDDVSKGNTKLNQSLKTRGITALKGVARRVTGGRVKKKKKKRKCCNKKDVFQLV